MQPKRRSNTAFIGGGIAIAIEKLNPSKLPKDINNIERALNGDTLALTLFTSPD